MSTDHPKIFISIAAYRDPELVPTVQDCLSKARVPERLRFGIFLQQDDQDAIPGLFAGDQFTVISTHWRHSRGTCWARALTMQLWQGEEWFLQLDSHHRFVQDWDMELLDQARLTGSPKPLLSTCAPHYEPSDDNRTTGEPLRIAFDRFDEDGILLTRTESIPDWQTLQAPVPAHYLCAHLLFAPGSFVREVPYDPLLYFWGEEITLAVRAYSCGYDLFHPSKVIAWHRYLRTGQQKHWDDHTGQSGASTPWWDRDRFSRDRIGRFFEDPFGAEFPCGRVRSLEEFQDYAGLNFRLRECTWKAPGPADDGSRTYRVRIRVEGTHLPAKSFEDIWFWYVGVFDGNGDEILRQDADESELRSLLREEQSELTIARHFDSRAIPASWAIWPCTRDGEWLDKAEGKLCRDADDTQGFYGVLSPTRV